jgi:hypothetical protein
VIDRSECAEAFRQPFTLNHCLTHFVVLSDFVFVRG